MTAIEVGGDLAPMDAALGALPNRPAVFALWPGEGQPYLSKTALLRRRLLRLLGEREKPSRLLNLRHAVRRIEYRLTGSAFESGVILYELASGRHPFAPPDAEDFQAIRAIQFLEPEDLSAIVSEISPELKSVIAACLEKNPGARTASSAEVREGLKTIMKALRIETGIIPGDAAANLPATGAEAEKRTTGLLSMLAERFRESAGEHKTQNSLVVDSRQAGFFNDRFTATLLPMQLRPGWRGFRRW